MFPSRADIPSNISCEVCSTKGSDFLISSNIGKPKVESKTFMVSKLSNKSICLPTICTSHLSVDNDLYVSIKFSIKKLVPCKKTSGIFVAISLNLLSNIF